MHEVNEPCAKNSAQKIFNEIIFWRSKRRLDRNTELKHMGVGVEVVDWSNAFNIRANGADFCILPNGNSGSTQYKNVLTPERLYIIILSSRRI